MRNYKYRVTRVCCIIDTYLLSGASCLRCDTWGYFTGGFLRLSVAARCCLLSRHGHRERLGSCMPPPPLSWPLLQCQVPFSKVKVIGWLLTASINAATNFLKCFIFWQQVSFLFQRAEQVRPWERGKTSISNVFWQRLGLKREGHCVWGGDGLWLGDSYWHCNIVCITLGGSWW